VLNIKNISPVQLSVYLIVGVGALTMLAPFYFMFIFATHDNASILSVPPPLWVGDQLGYNLSVLMQELPHFWHNLWVTFYVSFSVTALNLFFCSLAGYAFAMFDFKYKKTLFAMVLGTMLIPAFLGMIPTAVVMAKLGWMNSAKALVIPGAVGAVGIFLMRQYIGSAIPNDIIDAARMDGCGEFGIYWRIIVPLIAPAMGTLGLIVFIGSWNNFMGALIVMNDMKMFTVSLALRALQGGAGSGQVPWGAMCAGAALSVIPLIIIFAISSRKMIEGMTAGALKG